MRAAGSTAQAIGTVWDLRVEGSAIQSPTMQEPATTGSTANEARRRGIVRLGAALLAGAVMATGYPPYEWTLVSWAGLMMIVWLLLTAGSGSLARWSAFASGVSFFGILLSWLIEVELLAFYPLVLLQALPMVLVGYAAHRAAASPPLHVVVAVAGSWALAEFLRVRVPFGGFPWGTAGLTVSSTPLRPSAQYIGSSGWSVLLLMGATLIALMALRRVSWRPLAGLLLVGVALGVAGNVWPAVPDGASRRVAIVQGNSPCPGTRCANERAVIFESHLDLTAGIEAGSVDLVVWPESSTGGGSDPVQNPEVGGLIADQAARIGAPLLVGGDRGAGPENFINVNVVFDSRGGIEGEYRKRHPVPFGEYVPLRELLDWIPALDRVPRDLLPGDRVVLFDAAGVPFASVISYEGAFARYERESMLEGAAFLVVATNEASYGDTPASDQLIAISRLRAAELGTDVVHAAVTGRSAMVGADGRIEGLTDLFERTVTTGEVRARTAGPTVYVRLGDWLQVLALLAFLGMTLRRRLTRLGGNPSEASDVSIGRASP